MKQPKYRDARRKAGIKSERAAVELGVSIATLFNWERGTTSPTADNLVSMARLYKVSTDYLLGLT